MTFKTSSIFNEAIFHFKFFWSLEIIPDYGLYEKSVACDTLRVVKDEDFTEFVSDNVPLVIKLVTWYKLKFCWFL